MLCQSVGEAMPGPKDVVTNQSGRPGDISGAGRGQHGTMFLDRAVDTLRERQLESNEAVCLGVEPCDQFQGLWPLSGSIECQMELPVSFAQGSEVLFGRRVLERQRVGFQRVKIGRRHSGDRATRQVGFEHRPQFENLGDLSGLQRSDDRPPVRDEGYHPFSLKSLQGFTQGDPGDTEFRGQGFLPERGPDCPFTGKQPLPEGVGYRLSQSPSRDGLHFVYNIRSTGYWQALLRHSLYQRRRELHPVRK